MIETIPFGPAGGRASSVCRSLVLTAVLAGPLLPSLSVAATPNCELKQLASVNLEESAVGHLLVPVTIDGSDALMVLNTNTLTSTLTDSAISRLGLKTRSASLRIRPPTGKSYDAQIAMVNKVSIGRAQYLKAEFMEYLSASLSTVAQREYADERVVGVLGMDILSNSDIELDIGHHMMKLYSQDHCAGQVVYWSRVYDFVPIRLGPRGEFYFRIVLEEKKIDATLTTVAPITTLTTDVTRRFFNFDEHSPDVQSETDASGKTISHYRAMQLDAVGFKVVNAQITLRDPPSRGCRLGTPNGVVAYEGCLTGPPLALGLNVLRKLRVYIATKEKVLYFTLTDVVDQN